MVKPKVVSLPLLDCLFSSVTFYQRLGSTSLGDMLFLRQMISSRGGCKRAF